MDSGEKALWIYEYGSNAFLEETKFSYIFICVTPHYNICCLKQTNPCTIQTSKKMLIHSAADNIVHRLFKAIWKNHKDGNLAVDEGKKIFSLFFFLSFFW